MGQVLGATDDSSVVYLRKNGKLQKVNAPGKKIHDDLKKAGYDAVEDIEDQLSSNKNFQPESPLIVLNGNKFKVAEAKLIDRDKYDPKKDK